MPFAGTRPAARRDRGFTLIELMVVIVIIGLASALALPMYADAIVKSKKSALVSEGRKIYGAMMAYYTDYSMFPPDASFDKATMEPLASEGYLNSAQRITGKLMNDQLLLYIAPDVGGANQQFVIVMRLEKEPDVIVAVVHTNLVSEDGDWVDGVFLITGEDLEDAPEPVTSQPVDSLSQS